MLLMMMSESGNVDRFPTKIASNARRRRLEIRSVKNCQDEMNPHFVGDGYVNEIPVRRVIKDVTSSESTKTAGKESGTDDGKLTSSELSSSSENEGMPLEILVTGGENDGEESSRDLTLSHGSISVIGRRRAMEDAVTVAPGVLASYDFFAVYDGHGGCTVAQACRDRLHQLLAKEMEGRVGGGERVVGGGIDWVKVMVACFSKMDDEVNGGGVSAADGSVSVKAMGSTAVVVMVGKEEVVVANCGDSRAVLCRGGVAVPLSRDHKPDRPDERERVEAAGGRVIDWNGWRVLGVLATSRSIGDHYLKPYVISEPEVTVNERTKSDDFIIIASDGLWDVVSNQVVCEVVRRSLDGQMKRRFSKGLNESNTAEAAAMLVKLAMARGSKDNISVIVVELKRSTYRIC